MEPFFRNISKTEKRPQEKNKTIRLDCNSCGLFHQCKTPKMEPSGKGEKGILVIAEAPGKTEDEEGTQLIGRAGKVLRNTLKEIGLDLDRDCRKTNAVCCRPPGNRIPKPKEINCCRSRLFKEIEKFKPKLIIVLGKTAAISLLGHRWKKDFPKISALRGWVVPDRDTNCWVAYTFHPSFVMRSEDIPTVDDTFYLDLSKAKDHLNVSLPKSDKNNIRCVMEPEKVKQFLVGLKDNPPKLVALDYEASGLKVHAPGHFIRTCALAYTDLSDGKDCAVAFPMLKEIIPDFISCFLKNSNIKKVAQNVPYEESCGRAILGTKTKGWVWDTLLGSHWEDSRSGVGGLKFQTYVQFGVSDYSSHIEKYLTTGKKEGNAINKIDSAPLESLMKYNAMDSLETLRLAKRQRAFIPRIKDRGCRLLFQGMLALCDVENRGVLIDIEYCKKQEKELTEKIEEAEKRILEDNNVVKWKERMGGKFNLYSNDQLRETLYKFMKNSATRSTAKRGNPSVDKETLKELSKDVPFVKDLLHIRLMEKLKETYLKSWIREAVDGVLHPNFSLATVETFRSSCSRPNLQNVPVRDKEAQKLLRTAIIPRPGHQLLEIDFKQIEIAVGACYHKDPNMISYIKDPQKDMHRDMAMELFKLTKEQVHKDIRFTAKNSFVFAETYGSYYEQIAPDLWGAIRKMKLVLNDGTSLMKHLKKNNLGGYEKFVTHVKEVEDSFWGERFPKYNEWRHKWYSKYLKRGYLKMFTGFHCQGPLKKNQILNFPIQGTAFHVLLYTLIKLNKIIKKKGWKSRIVSQIHDSLVIDLVPSELKKIKDVVKIIISNLPKHWPWIIVPLRVEMEIAPIDRPWYEKKLLEED